MIPAEDVGFHPHSFADPAGRVFRWQEELYRGIRAGSAEFIAQLARERSVSDLVERGLLIAFEPTGLQLSGFDLIVRHPSIPFASYPHEWSCSMLRDAASTILDLATRLTHRGLALHDSHPWNVLFDGARPVWVDLGSVGPAHVGPGWPPEQEFRTFCLNPLILMASGFDRLARYLLPDKDGVSDDELAQMTGRSRWRIRRGRRPRSALDVLAGLRHEVEAVKMPPPAPLSEADAPGRVRELLARATPASVLEIDPASAWLAQPAAQVVPAAWATSSAPVAEALYRAVRGSTRALPLVLDFADPTPRRGIEGHWQLEATERLAADAVVALQPRSERVSPTQRATALAAFAHRLLITRCDRRDLDEFSAALTAWGADVREVPDDAGGVLVLAER